MSTWDREIHKKNMSIYIRAAFLDTVKEYYNVNVIDIKTIKRFKVFWSNHQFIILTIIKLE